MRNHEIGEIDEKGLCPNFLKATGKQLGLLVNFSHYPKLEWERHIYDDRWINRSQEPPDFLS
jgi:hypothetical protein